MDYILTVLADWMPKWMPEYFDEWLRAASVWHVVALAIGALAVWGLLRRR
jgi:hypothetical protein